MCIAICDIYSLMSDSFTYRQRSKTHIYQKRYMTSKDSPTYMLQAQGVSGCYVVKVNSESIKTTLKYVVYAW